MFYVGNLKGVGRVYQQTFTDTYAVARPLPSQAPSAQLAEATTPLPLACAEPKLRLSRGWLSFFGSSVQSGLAKVDECLFGFSKVGLQFVRGAS